MMSNLNDLVEKNRGLIKRIQLVIPGYRGYRIKEDLRDTDSLLRAYISKAHINPILTSLENSRTKLAQSLELSILQNVGDSIYRVKAVDSKISHAEQGYSGISPTYRVEGEELHALYEFDVNLIDNLDALRANAESVYQRIASNQYEEAKNLIEEMTRNLDSLDSLLEMRRLGFIKTMIGRHTEVEG